MSSGGLPPSAPLSTSVAPSAYAWNRPPRSCGCTASNSARRGVSGGLARRDRRLCSERSVVFRGSFLHLTFARRNPLNALARANPSKVLKPQCRLSDARPTIGICVGPCPLCGHQRLSGCLDWPGKQSHRCRRRRSGHQPLTTPRRTAETRINLRAPAVLRRAALAAILQNDRRYRRNAILVAMKRSRPICARRSS
jgi:hypothetical protein